MTILRLRFTTVRLVDSAFGTVAIITYIAPMPSHALPPPAVHNEGGVGGVAQKEEPNERVSRTAGNESEVSKRSIIKESDPF